MKAPNIRTFGDFLPKIYAYTTPEIARHNGWLKIGYTEQDVHTRIRQQTRTADVLYHLEWYGTAIFDDGSGKIFTDKDFQAYLRKKGFEQGIDPDTKKFTEWLRIAPDDARYKFYDFKSKRDMHFFDGEIFPYTLRDEQKNAVNMTLDYFKNHKNGEFLWNAKPRFGKTLATYDLIKQMNAKRVLIVTNRPAIANSWYDDYIKFINRQSGYFFVSNVDGVKDRDGVLSYEKYEDDLKSRQKDPSAVQMGMINFVSLQDLKGAIDFGGDYPKLKHISRTNWDILVIDEAHEAIDTQKTDIAFNRISRNFTLHLSGTPFKALANEKFPENAIFNWTYADEQRKKRELIENQSLENPYISLPKLNLYTYQMSEIILDEIRQGIEIDGNTEEFAFDLNEFFATNNGKFIHDKEIDKFLDALTTQTKYPFSTPELRSELKHTFWLLNRVDSALALQKKLEKHAVFGEYKIIPAVGNISFDDTKKSYDRVVKAISENEKTITLSVGQLTTGVTIPEWSGVLMLSNVSSPALYMQAAFRSQNPHKYYKNGQFYRKENAYVFDFDPARTLTIFEEFANDLSKDTSGGKGDTQKRREHITELLNFFPVIGEDDNGEMIELDAEKVLSIPRKIRSKEVVRRGFMSNFLFQNISNVFHAPQEILDILEKLPTVTESSPNKLSQDDLSEIPVDDDGEIDIPQETVIGISKGIFGDKIYGTIPESVEQQIENTVEQAQTGKKEDYIPQITKTLTDTLIGQVVAPIIDETKKHYGDEIKGTQVKKIEKELTKNAEKTVTDLMGNFAIEEKQREEERKTALENPLSDKTAEEINREYDAKRQQAVEQMTKKFNEEMQKFVEQSEEKTVEHIETAKAENEKKTAEDTIKDHLRGFSRTIPSFLMAYGDENVTLANFDTIIPDKVFLEVTSITLEQFRFLRDGGEYTDTATGEIKFFNGHLFEPVVFDDSVKEFIHLKQKLANYFDESNEEDIFDYIPPQKTNQIFTPKKIVKKMVDMLEEENPNCFDDPDKTFIDLYMKSGLYIAEIVKKLYNSNGMKEKYPDTEERLKHIFEKQVYGLAPTEIIYRIAINFILGFADETDTFKHNFRQADTLPAAKEGTLQALLNELYS